MSVSLKSNFWSNARGVIFKDANGVVWAINASTNEISASVSGAAGGTVTSVGLVDVSTTPIYTISGSPVTASGNLAFALKAQSANLVFAGPGSGSAAQPSFRSLVLADLPTGYPYANLGSAPAVSSGTFTGTLTGMTTSPTTTCTYYRIGNLVVIFLGTGTGTSNATTFTMTGLPTALQSSANNYVVGGVSLENNGASVVGTATVLAGSGTVSFYNGAYSAAWTSSGIKGMNNGVLTYLLN